MTSGADTDQEWEVSVVMPCLNEEETIGDCIRKAQKSLAEHGLRGEVVVCDRFASSTLVYQGWGRGLAVDFLGPLNDLATEGISPDLTVLLDAPVEVGLARRPPGEPDNFERESVDFHTRVREGYLALVEREPEKWLVVDATLPEEQVSAIIWERVSSLLRQDR